MCEIIGKERFLTVPEAARDVGVSRMTMYRWASRGKATQGEKLSVVKDRKTGHYLVAERSVHKLTEAYGPAAPGRFQTMFHD